MQKNETTVQNDITRIHQILDRGIESYEFNIIMRSKFFGNNIVERFKLFGKKYNNIEVRLHLEPLSDTLYANPPLNTNDLKARVA